MLTDRQIRRLDIMIVNLYLYNQINEIYRNKNYWVVLNKLAKHKKWSPNTISNKIKELGTICFNNDKNNHPIDWLYNEYK